MKISEIVTVVIQIAILVTLVVMNLNKRAANMQQPSPNPAPNITQTASPTIINNNGRSGWAEDVPHTVNDAAEFLGRTPDTIRSYIPRWIENGESIDKTQGGMWIFPPGFTPYIPE
jgi:hypothetical protein